MINSRLFLVLIAYVCLVFGVRRILDEEIVAAWRKADALVGPDALPANVAGLILIAIVSVTLAKSGLRTRGDRLGFFGLLAFEALLSTVGAFPAILVVVSVLLYWADNTSRVRRGAPPEN